MLGEVTISIILGASRLLSIIFSNPLPIETAKKIWGIIPINVAKKKLFIFTLKIVGIRQLNCQGIPPTKRYTNKYINSDFLNLVSSFLNLFKNFSLIKSFKKKLPNIYKSVAPILNPITTINVPIHFPNINPPSKATGDPKPKNGNTHNIVKNKKIIDNKNKLEFLSSKK